MSNDASSHEAGGHEFHGQRKDSRYNDFHFDQFFSSLPRIGEILPIMTNKIEQLFFADHRGVMPPVILENSGVVHVAQDESTSLVCVAQACPTPEYR